MIDLDVRAWLQLINLVGTFAVGCWLYLEKRSDRTNERVDGMRSQIDRMDRDLAGLRETARLSPSHADLAEVYRAINEVAATSNQLVGEMSAQSEMLRLILNRVAENGMPGPRR